MQVRLIILVLLCSSLPGIARQPPAMTTSRYDRTEPFQPLTYPNSGGTRSADGRPGAQYWQNRADYTIEATLDTLHDRLSGQVDIRYMNNSPLSLPFVWLYLEQNFKNEHSRYNQASLIARNRISEADVSNGMEIESVAIVHNKKAVAARYIIEDTRMQIRLEQPVREKGGGIHIRIAYHFKIPVYGGGRMGITRVAKGKIYQVAQWYPRMAVYDDVNGWNTVPYQIGAEFYLPFGSFNYTIKLPANMMVAGSGGLVNEKQVLAANEYSNLQKAKNSDSTVLIRDPSAKPGKGYKTWKFSCTNTRDVAWAASAAFICDGARINLPEGKKALALSVYAEEAAAVWKHSTQFTKTAVEFHSANWFPYPLPVAVNVAGNVPGMEYPGLAFCDMITTEDYLWEVTCHEFAHNWFPMIVGTNERKDAWMDEGFTVFISEHATRQVYNGRYYNSKLDSLSNWQINQLFSDNAVAVMNTPMVAAYNEVYWKPSVALKLLRGLVLGPERFDFALRTYIAQWAFKHPTPWDFFKTMENAAGEDLGWFWKGWFLNKPKLDHAVLAVTYVNAKDLKEGARITIQNNEQMVMPVTIQLTEENGSRQTLQLPVEIWQKGGTWTFWCRTQSRITEVLLDPFRQLPDINRSNNRWSER